MSVAPLPPTRHAAPLDAAEWFFWPQDVHIRFTELSDSIASFLEGADAHFLLGKALWDLPVVGIPRVTWQTHRAHLARREPFHDFVLRLRNPHGKLRWWSLNGRPAFDANGHFIGYQGIAHDITRQQMAGQPSCEESTYRKLVELSPDAIFVHSHGDIRLINESGCRLFGAASDSALVGQSVMSLLHPDWHATVRQRMARLIRHDERPPAIEVVMRTLDGRDVDVEVTGTRIQFDGQPAILSHARDITARKQAEQALRDSEARYRHLVEHALDLVMQCDASSRIRYVNGNAAQQILGHAPDAVIGRSFLTFVRPDQRAKVVRFYQRQFREGMPESYFECVIIGKHGQEIWLGQHVHLIRTPGQPPSFHSICRDITDRKRQEDSLRQQANHDPLTGLPNRNLLADRFTQALFRAQRTGTMVAVLLLDLDRFKAINDNLGHGFGDELLQAISARLLECCRKQDTVARLGGDEFVVILPDIAQLGDCTEVTMRIQRAIAEPLLIGTQPIRANASIGVSLYPHDGEDMDTLLNRADVAMYQAKRQGGANWQLHGQQHAQETPGPATDAATQAPTGDDRSPKHHLDQTVS